MQTTIMLTANSITFELTPENEVEKMVVRELPPMECQRINGQLVLSPAGTKPAHDYLEIPAFLRRATE